MPIISQNTKYLPHDLNTRYYACKTYLANKHKKLLLIGISKIFAENIIYPKLH